MEASRSPQGRGPGRAAACLRRASLESSEPVLRLGRVAGGRANESRSPAAARAGRRGGCASARLAPCRWPCSLAAQASCFSTGRRPIAGGCLKRNAGHVCRNTIATHRDHPTGSHSWAPYGWWGCGNACSSCRSDAVISAKYSRDPLALSHGPTTIRAPCAGIVRESAYDAHRV